MGNEIHLMYCKALECKMMQSGCNARKKLVKEQFHEELLPKQKGRQKKKILLIGAEECLNCKTGLIELERHQVIGITETGESAKICKECKEEKALYCFDGNGQTEDGLRNVCVFCLMKRKNKEEAMEDYNEKSGQIPDTKSEDVILVNEDEVLTLDFGLVKGLMEELEKDADKNIRSVQHQALWIIKQVLIEGIRV